MKSHNEESDALGTSEKFYREAVENAKNIIYAHDLAGRYTYLNKAGEQITGYTRQEVVRMSFADVVAQEQMDDVRRRISEKLAGAEHSTYEVEIITKDERRVTLETRSWLIYQDNT